MRRISMSLACALVSVSGLVACGGGSGGATTTTGPSASGTSTTLVTADIDGDRKPDLIELDRDDLDAPICRQGDGAGGFTLRPDWADHPIVRAVRSDARRRDDASLASDDGIHRARGVVRGAAETPYAVLHLGPDDEAPEGPPSILELRPEEGHAGAWVAIHGAHFTARDADDRRVIPQVTFDGLAAEVFFARPRFLLVAVPGGTAQGAVDVVVTRGSGADAVASTAAPFTVVAQPTPVLESVHPTPLVAGALAYVRGMHLGTPLDDIEVTLGGTALTRFLAFGRRLVFEVPATATQGPLVVTVNGTPSAPFDVAVADTFPTPTVSAITPAAASPGSLVQLDGANFFVLGDRLQVFFDGTRAAIFGLGHDRLVAIVPPGATSGDVTVQVGDRTSAGNAFTVVPRGAPALTSVDPVEGTPGTRVDLAGTDLYDLSAWRPDRLPPFRDPFGDVTVSFGTARSFFFRPTITGLRVSVPLQAPVGIVDVQVRVGSQTSNTAPFTVK